MQAFLHAPPTSLTICGWTARTPAHLWALEARGLTAVAVGDRSAAALASAVATFRDHPVGPARYQHPREMLRRTSADVVLLDMPDAAGEAAVLGQRCAAVLVAGDAIEPETLEILARMNAVAAIVRAPGWCAPIAVTVPGRSTTSRLPPPDRSALAIGDALNKLARGGMGPERLRAEAAMLRLVGRSLDNTSAAAARPRWDVIAGNDHQSARPRGHLRLVPA